MNPAMIAELARKIVEEQVHQNLWFYLCWLCLILLASFFGSWVRGYATDDGKFKAIERNFESVLEQLRKSTSATTEIQVALNHQDWSSREFKTLRREKLENLLSSLFDARDWSYKILLSDPDGSIDVESSPINNFLATGGLYFPELEQSIFRFYTAHHEFVIGMLSTVGPVWDAKLEYETCKVEFDAYHAIPSEQSAAKGRKITEQLLSAQRNAGKVRRDYKFALVPLQKKIQIESGVVEKEVKSLMRRIITPS